MDKQFYTFLSRCTVAACMLLSASPAASGAEIIIVKPSHSGKDMTEKIQSAINKAARKSSAEIRLSPGVYDISRLQATPKLQHITNTTSVEENPDPTKHFGLYLHNLENVVIDGQGAVLLTHGEMTSIAVDSCRNVTIRNLSIRAADPSVVELTVTEVTDSTLSGKIIGNTGSRIDADGKLHWLGEGWDFTGGIAQLYDGIHTWRCESPTDRYTSADISGTIITFHYNPGEVPDTRPGQVYQLRHSYRTEVATFINRSSDVTFENVNYNFLGNFGIVGQFSRNITLDNVTCAPDPESGRTCAGFADFVQMSGCSGLVKVTDCDFAGAHDDPINVHGTHLKVTDWKNTRTLVARYMHGQTFGFEPFTTGDEIAITDPHTLMRGQSAKVTGVKKLTEFEWEVTLDRDTEPTQCDAVIENMSANPDVEITGCRFTLTPTRGILLSSSGKCVIAGNTFLNIPMSSILIADDGRSWYESGPVRDVTISGNRFIDCASPVISIAPENDRYEGAVHENIRITGNEFCFSNNGNKLPVLVSAKSVDGLTITGNTSNIPAEQLRSTTCTSITTD